ncbi:MAG: tetratricopeptide repeat protein, partial [Acidimicrobiia bacterium]|nr:tetratricopeptide repeat protein [Acidimicrobiia bacterium]
CTTLGPILEKVVDATGGQVVLAKVDVDANPAISQAFQVQSIPSVYAMRNGQPVDGFMGSYPEHFVQEFVDKLLPSATDVLQSELLGAGDEASLRKVLDAEPGNEEAVIALAELLVERGETEEALALLERIPESDRTRKVAATARLGDEPADDYDNELVGLLDRVREDDEARQRFVDLLEVMGPDDPRTASYRKQLTARLF